MTAKEVFENLISTIEESADENNEAVITNVKLWAKSWRQEMETEVNNGVLDDVISCKNCGSDKTKLIVEKRILCNDCVCSYYL